MTAFDAAAQSTEGAFQLGLSTPLVAHSSGTVEYETGLLDAESDVSATTWGLRGPVNLELGYGLSDLIVLGAIVSIGGESVTTELDAPGVEESESSGTLIAIGPKVDLHFGQGAVKPFVGATIAFVSSSTDTDAVETSLTGFELGGRAGVRLFLAPGLSLDPALAVAYASASGEAEATSGIGDADVSSSVFSVGLMLGLSGWLR